jgi:hypothetical protein
MSNIKWIPIKKKPVVVKGFQLSESMLTTSLLDRDNSTKGRVEGKLIGETILFFINTLEGKMRAEVGDWVIEGISSELYPVKRQIFEETYERYDGDKSLCWKCYCNSLRKSKKKEEGLK